MTEAVLPAFAGIRSVESPPLDATAPTNPTRNE